MRPETAAPTIRLADYTPPPHLVDRVDLIFRLDRRDRGHRPLGLRPNPGPRETGRPISGSTEAASNCGPRGSTARQSESALTRTPEGLRIAAAALPDGAFLWEAETVIAPAANTALEGLYMSKGMYCTQCEAHGFARSPISPTAPT